MLYSEMRPVCFSAAGIFALVLLGTPLTATTWHVPSYCPTIQAGIDSAAAGDTVEVACGIYYEHDILVQSDLVLRSESGEPSCVTVDAGRLGRVIEVGGGANVTIEGFTITQGLKSAFGGGIYVCDSSARITHCSFVENEAGPYQERGGGLAFAHWASQGTNALEVTHCSFVGNHATSGGGGVAAQGTGDHIEVQMSDCVFVENAATTGGAMYLLSCSPMVSDCVFLGNTALSFDGGAIAQLFGTALFSRCLVARNEAWRGSAFWFFLRSGNETTVSGCTIVANIGPNEAIGVSSSSAGTSPSPDFENTVIAFNEGASFLESGICYGVASPPQFSCCDIYGNMEGDWISCIAGQLDSLGNISADPLFCDPGADDFTLHADSPCLPGNHPAGWDCGLIGALGQGCGPVALTPKTWARVKAMYR